MHADSEWIIRQMMSKDIDQILEIEIVSFPTPWSRRGFEQELIRQDGISLVAKIGDTVIGYIIGWFGVDEIHIANLAVHPDWRRQGVARSLIQACIHERQICHWAWLEVRSSNINAQSLYRKLGFREIGIRKKYYVQENEDALLMAKEF
jgi:ribosomal-protein-alanine N-acetyltransferase